MVRFTIHIFFIVPQLILLLLLSAEENIQNQPCPTSFLCGKLGSLTFPFNDNSQPLCGLYPINCTGPTPKIQLRKGGYWFQILNISQTNSIFINYTDLLPKRNSKNCESFASLALPENSIISNVSTSDSLTIFNCSSYDTNYSAFVTCGDYELYYNNTIKTSPPRCSIVRLPTSRLDISANPQCYSCLLKGSRCVSDERNEIKCSGVSKGIGCLIFVSCPLIFLIWRSYKKVQSSSDTIFGVSKGTIGAKFMPNRREIQKNMEAYLSKYGPLPVRRYSYVNLKKMTNNFTTKLGQGGYGDVYKGKLENGCLVAVKMLNESKDWIYKRLELGQELGLSRILNEDENERAKKMITVSLWCIQTNPSNRPAIGKVIDMLEGSLESLQLPPKPVLSTTLREPADTDSTTLLSY